MTWIWVSSGSWWWTGKPGVLQFVVSQRVRHDWVTELSSAERCLRASHRNAGDEQRSWVGCLFLRRRPLSTLPPAAFPKNVVALLACCCFLKTLSSISFGQNYEEGQAYFRPLASLYDTPFSLSAPAYLPQSNSFLWKSLPEKSPASFLYSAKMQSQCFTLLRDILSLITNYRVSERLYPLLKGFQAYASPWEDLRRESTCSDIQITPTLSSMYPRRSVQSLLIGWKIVSSLRIFENYFNVVLWYTNLRGKNPSEITFKYHLKFINEGNDSILFHGDLTWLGMLKHGLKRWPLGHLV